MTDWRDMRPVECRVVEDNAKASAMRKWRIDEEGDKFVLYRRVDLLNWEAIGRFDSRSQAEWNKSMMS